MGIGAGAFRIILGGALLWSALSFAQGPGSRAPIVVAVLDTPIDYTHPLLASVGDAALLTQLTFQYSGRVLSWWELNAGALENYRSRLSAQYYTEQVQFLDAVSAIDSGKVSFLNSHPQTLSLAYDAYLNGLFRYLSSKRWRESLEAHSRYQHGTHVAGIAVGNLPGVRLIGFPVIGAPGGYGFHFDEYNSDEDRRLIREEWDQVGHGLRQAGARVANLSFASSDAIIRDSLLKGKSRWWKWENRRQIRAVIRSRAQIYREEMEQFFSENPQTVFVLAAGNEYLQLDRYARRGKMHTGQITAPNLVVVGSVRDSGRWSLFSNRSTRSVQIAAPGEAAVSSIPGNQYIHMTGTSMAAPMVTRRIAEILISNPALNSEQAIAELFSERHSAESPRLRKKVARGRALKNPTTCVQLLQKEEIWEDVDLDLGDGTED